MEAKLFKMSAPVPLRERPKNKGDVNRVNGANSGQVSTRSSVVYPERCTSAACWTCFFLLSRHSRCLVE